MLSVLLFDSCMKQLRFHNTIMSFFYLKGLKKTDESE